MSITELKENMRTQLKVVMGVIAVIFVIGAFYSFGTPGARQAPREGGSGLLGLGPSVVFKVHGQDVSRDEFLYRVSEVLERAGTHRLQERRQVMVSLLDMYVNYIAMERACEEEKIKVSRAEREAKRDEIAQQIFNAQYPPDDVSARVRLKQILTKRDISVEEYIAEVRATRTGSDEELTGQLRQEKLQELIGERGAQPVSDAELEAQYDEVNTAQVSFRPEMGEDVDLEKALEEARKRAGDVQTRLVEGKITWEQALEEGDDDQALKDAGGEVGWRGRRFFESGPTPGIFDLKKGEISPVIDDGYQLRIVKMLDRKRSLPEDFKEKKEEYRQRIADERRWTAWQSYQTDLRSDAEANLEILDPELAAYRMLTQMYGPDAEATPEAAIAALRKALETDDSNPSLYYELGRQLAMKARQEENDAAKKKGWQEALPMFVKAAELDSNAAMAHLELAEAHKALGQKQQAIAKYVEATDYASATDDRWNYEVHLRAQQGFQELGEQEKADEAQKWAEDYMASQRSTPMFGG